MLLIKIKLFTYSPRSTYQLCTVHSASLSSSSLSPLAITY